MEQQHSTTILLRSRGQKTRFKIHLKKLIKTNKEFSKVLTILTLTFNKTYRNHKYLLSSVTSFLLGLSVTASFASAGVSLAVSRFPLVLEK